MFHYLLNSFLKFYFLTKCALGILRSRRKIPAFSRLHNLPFFLFRYHHSNNAQHDICHHGISHKVDPNNRIAVDFRCPSQLPTRFSLALGGIDGV